MPKQWSSNGSGADVMGASQQHGKGCSTPAEASCPHHLGNLSQQPPMCPAAGLTCQQTSEPGLKIPERFAMNWIQMNMCAPPASAALLMWAFAVSWAVKHCVGIASLPHLPATQQTSTLTSPTSWHKLIMKREREIDICLPHLSAQCRRPGLAWRTCSIPGCQLQ